MKHEPKSINEIIDLARDSGGFSSDRKLAAHMNISSPTIVRWRKNHAWPTDDHMEALAELAGLDPVSCVVELAIWKNEGHAKALWVTIAERLSAAAAAIFGLSFLAFPSDVQAASFVAEQVMNKVTFALDTLYIMENCICYLYTVYWELSCVFWVSYYFICSR